MIKNLDKSICYDDYWRFSFARHSRFIAKKGACLTPQPDQILDQYKFTNCYRALDRVSQYLIKNITNKTTHSKEDVFFRIILFKLFNKISTWESLEAKIGGIRASTFEVSKYAQALSEIKSEGNKIYSAAYIMPSGTQYGSKTKHINNLIMLGEMLSKGVPESVWGADTLEQVYKIFLGIPSLGKFLALQLSIDCAYSSFSIAEESHFVVAGPGAERGIIKCFPKAKPSDYFDIINYMQENQDFEFRRLGLDFQYLKNRKLQLIDCQNIFCELDKYLRVKRPEFNKGTKRIKQHYRPNHKEIIFELPRKWDSGI